MGLPSANCSVGNGLSSNDVPPAATTNRRSRRRSDQKADERISPCVSPAFDRSVSNDAGTSGESKTWLSVAAARTPPDGTTGLSWLLCSHRTCARVSAPESSGSPGSPAPIEVRRYPAVTPPRSSSTRLRFTPASSPANDRVWLYFATMVSSLTKLRTRRAVTADAATKNGLRPSGRYSSPPRRGSRADSRVEAQLGAGPGHVEPQVPRRELKGELVGGGVFEADAEHEKRRRVRLGTGENLQALPAAGFDELPLDGLVAIEPGENRELGLERGDIERLPDVGAQDLLDATLVGRHRADNRQELRCRQLRAAA